MEGQSLGRLIVRAKAREGSLTPVADHHAGVEASDTYDNALSKTSSLDVWAGDAYDNV